jgi:pimeloyl-ACP methyl ester carboxylesterase
MTRLLAPALLAATALPATALAQTTTSPDMCGGRITVRERGVTFKVPYCRSVAVNAGHPDATHAVIVIQSSSLNASDVLGFTSAAAASAGKAGTTAIFAPQFPVKNDIAQHDLADNVPVWSLNGWKTGSNSLAMTGTRATQVSSAHVVDALVDHLLDRQRFPKLARIVVAGQSAGGQFAQRYAMTTEIVERARSRGVDMRFVPMNPSHYVYPMDTRPLRVRGTTSFRPVDAAFITQLNRNLAAVGASETHTLSDCAKYNEYPKGLDDLWSYPSRRDPEAMLTTYPGRDVRYLAGANDTARGGSLSMSCSSDTQGLNRLERATNFVHAMRVKFGSGVTGHRLYVVPGVGHSSRKMIQSPCGKKMLFDHGASSCAASPLPGQAPKTKARKRRRR